MKKMLAVLLAAVLLTGCAPGKNQPAPGKYVNLTAGLTPAARPEAAEESDFRPGAMMNFGVELLKAAWEPGKNRLLSPLSVHGVLSMTLNGADGATLAQMEQVLGQDRDGLNRFYSGYIRGLAGREELLPANSIWFRDVPGLEIEPEFLQVNVDCHDAGLFRAPFDQGTAEDINRWVSDRTGGRIPAVLDRIPDHAMMYLVNALAFQGKWKKEIRPVMTRTGAFRTGDGRKVTVPMMCTPEGWYLEDGAAVGFLKAYAGDRFVFGALLPKDGAEMGDYLDTLTGEGLTALLDSARQQPVTVWIPRFSARDGLELSDNLSRMGMERLFTEQAQLSGIGRGPSGPLYVGRVIHQTCMEFDEEGTKAGAATVVELPEAVEAPSEKEPKELRFNRPFVYLIADRQKGVPVFIGVLSDPGKG